ncbi:hypothetical protein QYF36_024247 [Acer negundo]|nr:hypothetical protein QYF36_024247 [Acer negundo]
MPQASKKKKYKGASSSGSSVGVRNPNFHVRLENNLGRAILSERNMDLNNLLRSEVPQMVDAMAMVHTEFDKGTPVKARGVDVGFSAQDINSYYGTQNYGDLDTGVPKLAIFRRYNLELAQDLCMPHVVKSWDDGDNQLLQHDLELIWAFWVIFLSFSIRPSRQITITVFELTKLLNKGGLQVVDTRNRCRRDDVARAAERAAAVKEAEDDAEEDPSAVPVGDRRPVWVDELFRR